MKWPDDIDPFDHGAITAREALVKSAPTDLVRHTPPSADTPDVDAEKPKRKTNN